MRFNPSCTVLIIGYGNYSYSQQQVAWSRAKEIKNLLVSKYGIDQGRFFIRYGLQGADYLVELKGAGSLVASKYLINPAPPYPGLLDEKNKKVKKNSSIFKR